ncbi:acyl-CoA N-acyltransferase [Lipomyces chichibuensis]|uniref:acyl-CoA N-acyltransferase n=1 Tax=Lipomyces chichibuensis TaxID=1546026 RepID=UPI0033434BAA
MEIRIEVEADIADVREVEEAAFPTKAEAALVDRLRADGSIVLSLVAVENGTIVGHVVFSRMESPTRSLGLGPVCVLASHRQKGVAAALIRKGLNLSKQEGWAIVFVLGDPTYYKRFGFDPDLAQRFTSPYAGPHLMALQLQPDASREGPAQYAPAFALLD